MASSQLETRVKRYNGIDYDDLLIVTSYNKLLDVPSTFPPSSHNHDTRYVRFDTASQGLTDTQKSNARTNIGAGISNFTGYTSSNKLSAAYISGLAAVATSGSYNDLSNKPTIYTDCVRYVSQSLTDAQKTQARTNIGAGTSSFSGSYNDLSDKPTIPTKVSQLTNDSGFITGITSAMVTTALGYTPANSSHNHNYIITVGDNRSVATKPNDYSNMFRFQGLKTNPVIGSPSSDTYSYLIGLRGWSDSSGGNSWELAFTNTAIFVRNGATTSWGSWYRLAYKSEIPTKVSQLSNDSGYITGITSSMVTTALGYTPYNSSNPNGYTSNTGTVTSVAVKMNGSTKGTITTSGTIDLGTVITSHQDISGKLDKTGGTITGDLIITAPHRDNYYASNLCRHFSGNTPTQFVIKTKIKFVSSAQMPIIRIYGYAYGEQSPIELRVGFYIYDDTLGWAGAVSTGAWKPEVYLFRYTENSTNYVAVGFKGACYFCGFQVDAQVGALGQFDTNFSIDGWTTTHNGSDTSVNIIPAVGTDKCILVSYRTMKTDISGNAASASKLNTDAGSSIKPVYFNNGVPVACNTSLTDYLPLSGGTMTGDLVIGDATNELYFRTSSGWQSGMYYHRTGSEAMVFCNNQVLTSWIFESGISPGSRLDWSTFDGASGHPSVPSMQIKNQKVVINKFIAQNTEAAYNLDVGGTANATTIYENGTAIDTIMDNKIQVAIGDAIAASY